MTMKETFHTRSLSNEQVANHDRCQTLFTPEVQKKNFCHALQDVLKILVNNRAKLCWVSPTLSRFFITLCKDLGTCVLGTCSKSNFKGKNAISTAQILTFLLLKGNILKRNSTFSMSFLSRPSKSFCPYQGCSIKNTIETSLGL